MERFAHVSLVMFTERVFPEVLEEVVLVLAEGFDKGPSADFELHQGRNVEDLMLNPRCVLQNQGGDLVTG